MPDVPMKMYWMGDDIETLSREQLLEVIHCLERDLKSTRHILEMTLELHKNVRAARARSRP